MFGDLHNVKGRIKTIDKDLDMKYLSNGMYEVTHKGGHFMSVSKSELHGGIVEKIREIVYKNVNADILAEIEANNNKIDVSKQKDLDNFTESMAKEIMPLVRRID